LGERAIQLACWDEAAGELDTIKQLAMVSRAIKIAARMSCSMGNAADLAHVVQLHDNKVRHALTGIDGE
jgi:hypothetical protein